MSKFGNVSELSHLDIGTGFGFLNRELTEARQTSLDRIYKKGNDKKRLRVKKGAQHVLGRVLKKKKDICYCKFFPCNIFPSCH